MKVYTVQDLETFERDEFGRLICPSGDYTQICSFGERCIFGEECIFGERCSFGKECIFGERCSFGERCRFGEECSFGERCIFGKACIFENIPEDIDRFVKIDRIGSRNGCTYFFKTLSNIYVRCGCFFGTIDEFEQKVKETHEHNEQYLKEYLEAIKYVKAIL